MKTYQAHLVIEKSELIENELWEGAKKQVILYKIRRNEMGNKMKYATADVHFYKNGKIEIGDKVGWETLNSCRANFNHRCKISRDGSF